MVYYFKEGRNAYTVNFDERERYIQEKRDISRKLLKKKRYEHAQEVIQDSIELCDSGTFEEDKRKLKNYHITNLKNKSLCQWKLKNWREMEQTCRDYIDLKQGKVKPSKMAKEGKIGPNAQTINLKQPEIKQEIK